MAGGDSSASSGDEEKKSSAFSGEDSPPREEDIGSGGNPLLPRNDLEKQDEKDNKKPTKKEQDLPNDIRVITQKEEETTNPSPKDPSSNQVKSSTVDQERSNRKKEELKELITKLETIRSSEEAATEGGSGSTNPSSNDAQEKNSSRDQGQLSQKEDDLNQLVTQLERVGSSKEEVPANTQHCSSPCTTNPCSTIQKRNSISRQERLHRKKEEMKQ